MKHEKCIQIENKENIKKLNIIICEKDIELQNIMDDC